MGKLDNKDRKSESAGAFQRSEWETEWMDIEYQTLRQSAKYFSERLSFQSQSKSRCHCNNHLSPELSWLNVSSLQPKGPDSNTDTAIISVKRKVTSQ